MKVESTSAVPPLGACDLWIPGDNGDVKLKVRVQRSRAQFVAGENGSNGLVYQSGLEILEMDDVARDALGSILQQLGGAIEDGQKVAAAVTASPDEELDFRISAAI